MATDDSGNDSARAGFSAQELQNHHSSLLAKTLEYRFLAELTSHLLLNGILFDILHGDVDHQGHDVVIEANGVLRHIQLKIKVRGGKTDEIKASLKLAAKPSGCIVWMHYDPETLAIGPFGWFGDVPGERLPALGDKVAKHTKRDGTGLQGERANHRVVRARRFETIADIGALASELFGERTHEAMLAAHLRSKAGEHIGLVIRSLCPARLTWDNSVELAHLINGYVLAERAGLGDPFVLADTRLAAAQATGDWGGSLLQLWVALFLEHRRWRVSPIEPDPVMRQLLDQLCEKLQRSLASAGLLT